MARPDVVAVVVPVAVERAYSYLVPAGMPVAPGAIVAVPLGRRETLGVVWDGPADEAIERKRLKPVSGVVSDIPIGPELRRFVDWVAHWTLTERGMVLRMALRSAALAPEAPPVGLAWTGARPERLTPARERVLAVICDGTPRPRTAIEAEAGVSSAVLRGLIDAGVLTETPLALPRAPAPDPDAAPPALSDGQQHAAASLVRLVEAARFSVALLDGVTGSGKTDVFLEAAAAALKAGRQVLILMPEIALTGFVIERIARRFGARPAEWHSSMHGRARARVWRQVATGEARIVVGARSALFLPFRDLGLLVVDEEHDPGYKQEDGVVYNARDMAVVRARIGEFPAVLVSATPSVESRVNADQGRYRHIVLPRRAAGAELPAIRAIDLRRDPPPAGEWIAPALRAAAGAALSAGHQVLFFLNRRGYAPLTLCRQCGHRFTCPNCSAWLVEHRLRGRLACHHCGHGEPRPEACPACGAEDSLVACGPGVERIEEEVRRLWPERRVLVLSSDLAGGAAALRREFELVAAGGADIVVGTQLVAKGHTFPKLQLVGVVDADLGLAGSDPRAAERTFQLLTQVTGRAGRVAAAGEGSLQTHAPDHPVMRALVSGDSEAFYRAEIALRRAAGLPPFARLAAIIVSGPDKAEAGRHAALLGRTAPRADGVEVLGPAEAPLAILRGRHRFRLLVRAPRAFDVQAMIARWFAAAGPVRGSVRRTVDIDPQSFL